MAESEEESRQKILSYLAGRGGSVEDPNGVGLTAELATAVGHDSPAGLSSILRQMEAEGTIKRDVRGLRTYRISLAQPAAPASASSPPVPPTPAPAAPAPAARAAAKTAGGRGPGRLRAGKTAEPGSTTANVDRGADTAVIPVVTTEPPPPGALPVTTEADPTVASPTPPVTRPRRPRKGAAEPTVTLPIAETAQPDPTIAAPAPPAARTMRARRNRAAEPAGPVPTATEMSGIEASSTGASSTGASSADPTVVAPAPPIARRGRPRTGPTAASAAPVPAGGPSGSDPTAEPAAEALASPAAPAPPATTARPDAWRHFEPGHQNGSPTEQLGTPPAWDRSAGPHTAPAAAAAAAAPRERRAKREFKPKKERFGWWKEGPTVAAPPSRPIELIVGVGMAAVAVVAILITLIVGLSGPKGGKSDRGSFDACPLVTADEASAVLGGPSSPPAGVLGSCLFETASKKLVVAVTRDRAKQQYDETRTGSSQDVSGIGDSAYYHDGRLEILKGRNLLVITLQPGTPELPPSEAALAKVALSRL